MLNLPLMLFQLLIARPNRLDEKKLYRIPLNRKDVV